jgi:hypothetical protein
MKLHLSFTLGALALAFLMWSCHEQDEIVLEDNPADINDKPADVYVAGVEGGYAVYWKNGEKIVLDDLGSAASEIVVSGNDVYVAGHDRAFRVLYWKNGEKVILAQEGGVGSMAIVGNDVYASGCIYKRVGGKKEKEVVPTYWKNGMVTELQIPADYTDGQANAMYADGSDIYIVGAAWRTDNSQIPLVWKNGQMTVLSTPAPDLYTYVHTEANDVKVVDGHVYISGRTGALEQSPSFWPSHAVAWRDGELTVLDPDHFMAYATGVDVANGDFYVVGEGSGSTRSAGKYWKNGVEVIVEPSSNLAAMRVVGTDVYVVGEHWWFAHKTHIVACYWLNGERIELSSSETFAYVYGMYVVPHPK